MATNLGRCAYGRVSDTTPHHRPWDGTNFGSEANLAVSDTDIQWLVMKSNPDDAVEKCVAFWTNQLTGDNFFVQTWNGTTWTTQFSGRFAEAMTVRGFDLEYEDNGDIIVIFTDETTQVKYRARTAGSWDGSNQNAGSVLDDTPSIIVIKRANDTNTLFAVMSSNSSQLHAKRWTGTAWDNDIRIDDGTHTLSVKEQQCFDLAFEGDNNNCFVIFGDQNKDTQYRLFTTSWSAILDAYLAQGDKCFELRADWDHDSGADDIAIIQQLGNGNYEFGHWNGSTWQTVGSSLANQNKNERQLGIAFERSTAGTAIAVMDDKDDNIPLSYRTLVASTNTWSSISTLARSGGATINGLILNPDDGSDDMIVLISDQNDDLDSAKWDGSTFGDLEAGLVTDLPTTSKLEPFGFAFDFGVAPIPSGKPYPFTPGGFRLDV